MRELLTTKRIHIAARSLEAASGDSKGMPPLISGEPAFRGVRPQCPRCRANIDSLECQFCGFRMRIDHGIVYALPPERSAYYARFITEYERIRAAEGRGSQKDEFYLGLPYKDLSGKNSKQWKIRARSYDYLIKHVLIRNPQGEGGLILDLGAGNGWMSYRLALARFRPFAVDLLTNDHDGLGAAEHFRKQLPAMFPRFEAEFARMPFQDEQFDAVVFNASFHYAENYDASLREAFRCVRKGGIVVVSDTPWYSREDSGSRMVAERRAAFLNRFGTASDSISSLEYLTDDRLRELEERLSIHWTVHSPWYGFKWAFRPLVAKCCNRREPSRFRIYAARKP